jgi:hypothetical protein
MPEESTDPEGLIDLITPVLCPICMKTRETVRLTVVDDGEDIVAILQQGSAIVELLADYQLMKHIRDSHPDEFVPTFRRFPEDLVPEVEQALKVLGIEYLDTTAYAAGGAIQTTIHNN